jgi:hypothetical protein
MCHRWKPHDSKRAKMMSAEARLEAANDRLVDKDGIEVDRDLRNPHAMPVRRDARMQGFLVREPLGFRHEPFDQLKNGLGSVNEASKDLTRIDSSSPLPTFIEPGLGDRRLIGRRQKQQSHKIGALEMSPLLFKLGLTLGINQCRDRIGTWFRDRRSRGRAAPQRTRPNPSRDDAGRC